MKIESTAYQAPKGGSRSGQRHGHLHLIRTCTRINPRPTEPHHPCPLALPPHPFWHNYSPQKAHNTSQSLATRRGAVERRCGCGFLHSARVELRRSSPPPSAESERRRDLEIPNDQSRGTPSSLSLSLSPSRPSYFSFSIIVILCSTTISRASCPARHLYDCLELSRATFSQLPFVHAAQYYRHERRPSKVHGHSGRTTSSPACGRPISPSAVSRRTLSTSRGLHMVLSPARGPQW